jgi:HEPN domain-containing protein
MANRWKGRHDSRKYYEWLDHAQMDIQSARILLSYGGSSEATAFHCQQAIEKALKGYILFKTGSHVDGHNLTYLCRQAMRQDRGFVEYLDESAQLNRYYIETRYPSDIPLEFTQEQILHVLYMAEAMFRHISSLIFNESQEDEQGAG